MTQGHQDLPGSCFICDLTQAQMKPIKSQCLTLHPMSLGSPFPGPNPQEVENPSPAQVSNGCGGQGRWAMLIGSGPAGRAGFLDLSVRSICLSSACWRLWEQRGAKGEDVGVGDLQSKVLAKTQQHTHFHIHHTHTHIETYSYHTHVYI